MELLDRLENAFEQYAQRILTTDEWDLEMVGGHLWLTLPSKVSGGPDHTSSMLLGASRLADESDERLEVFVLAVGRYLAAMADELRELRLWADPQQVLDQEGLQTQDAFYRALHGRTNSGPQQYIRSASDILSEVLTRAGDAADDPGFDWEGSKLDFPPDYRALIDRLGPCFIDGLQLYAPGDIFAAARRLRESEHLGSIDIWPGNMPFLPAAKLGPWYLGWWIVEDMAPKQWTTAAVHDEEDAFVRLRGNLSESILHQMSGVDTEPKLATLQPRVLPAGWPSARWPQQWEAPETYQWYARAFQGTRAEIQAAAEFLGEHAPPEFLLKCLNGADLDADTARLPDLFRRGNGLLGLDVHQDCYVAATEKLLRKGAERSDELERLHSSADRLAALRVT